MSRSLYLELVSTTDAEEHARILLRRIADSVDTLLDDDDGDTRSAAAGVRAVSPLLGKLTDAISTWRDAKVAADGRVSLDVDARTAALQLLDPDRVRRWLLIVGAGNAEADAVVVPLSALLERVRAREVAAGAPFGEQGGGT